VERVAGKRVTEGKSKYQLVLTREGQKNVLKNVNTSRTEEVRFSFWRRGIMCKYKIVWWCPRLSGARRNYKEQASNIKQHWQGSGLPSCWVHKASAPVSEMGMPAQNTPLGISSWKLSRASR